ncbi:hypothetical protein K474DRAFT_1645698 [Panus rudis PR-1116 ss-1]|nr:hypothetical protein K474DRAFT_1645698 [Panus rudis PR-1116 ss-1]
MNIIEHAWEYLKHRVHMREPHPRNLKELWEAIQDEWSKLDLELLQKWYESMPARIAAPKKAQGGYTKY